jgi:hypothetical protein
VSVPHQTPAAEPLSTSSRFRLGLHACRATRADALFEVGEALICTPNPVHHLAQPSLEPELRRGHGSAYASRTHGRIDTTRLRQHLADLPLQVVGRLRSDRVRRGFRYIHACLSGCVDVPKPCGAGPGRPAGSLNKRPAPRHGAPKENKTGARSRP